MYDFATAQLTEITNQDWLQLYPDIEGDRIVWQDSRDCFQPNNTADWSAVHIWMYDLSTGQEHQITSQTGSQTEARIDSDRVFFLAGHPDGYYAIYLQDLAALGL
jgi:beta propeller repeat protein